jgi:MoaA/NifB/PqqE/SkfB family radical SAM enzyme
MQFQKTNRTAFLNFLRAKYEAWTGAVDVKSYPHYLLVDPSTICQLRCPTCPTGQENESRKLGTNVTFRNRTMLAGNLFDELLHELGDYLFQITLYNWGEPLLNKNLPEFIRKARALNIYTEIHTNLSLPLSDQFIDELLESGLGSISASIDGFSQETYQTYRRGGNFELAKRNLERLIKARNRLGLKTDIIWNFLVFSFNEHEIPAVRNFCKEVGITFNQREAFITNPDWLPSYRRHEANLQTLKVIPANTVQESAPAKPQPLPQKKKDMLPCAWHYDYSVVNADGSVSPCCAPWEQKHDFGVVKPGQESFADIWNNDLYRRSRGAFAGKEVEGLSQVETICVKCPYGDGIQNLYSGLDVHVISQFRKNFKGSDPFLDVAFDLLHDKKRFVEFFRENLINDFSEEIPAYSFSGKSYAFLRRTQRFVHRAVEKGYRSLK